jgi:hypothetical protein
MRRRFWRGCWGIWGGGRSTDRASRLGEAQAAAEHYARYEELLGLLDDPGRLANARGLVSRATRLRGDLATALAKAEDERRLGVQVKQPLREGRGWMHMAQAHAAAGDNPQAEHAFAEAAALLADGGDVRTPIEIATARGRFYLGIGRIHDAPRRDGRRDPPTARGVRGRRPADSVGTTPPRGPQPGGALRAANRRALCGRADRCRAAEASERHRARPAIGLAANGRGCGAAGADARAWGYYPASGNSD